MIPLIKNRVLKDFTDQFSMHKLILFGWGFFGVVLTFIIILQSFDVRSSSFGILILSIAIAFISNNSYDSTTIKTIAPWAIIIIVSSLLRDFID